MMECWTLKYARTLVGKRLGAFGDIMAHEDVKDLHSLLNFCSLYLDSGFDQPHIDEEKQAVIFDMYC